MRVLVQWAKSSPADWLAVDSVDWASLPKRPIPGSAHAVGTSPGWVNCINVQGVCFNADHYAVEDLGDGSIQVTTWNDDGDDWTADDMVAQVWTFAPLAPDDTKKGAINTVQSVDLYAGPALLATLQARARPTNRTLHPLADFIEPSSHATRHGIWLDDADYDAHGAALTARGWREWTDGLDPADIDADGNVRDQRSQGRYEKPKGTRTYFARDTARATTTHLALEEIAYETGTGVALNVAVSVGTAGALAFCVTTPASEPDSPAWPTGTYRVQLDITLAGGDLVFGLLTLGTVVGHFARVSGDLSTEIETHEQDEASFVGSGLHLATYTGAWTAGTDTDRFEALVVSERIAGHGTQTLQWQLNEADDFADGPWASATTAAGNVALFGANF